MWKRLPVTWKLFVAIAATVAIIVAALAALTATSMRAGFSQYLLQTELDGFDALVTALAETYDADAPGWPELAGTPDTWRSFQRENLQPAGAGPVGNPPPRARAPGDRRGPPPGARPPPNDPLQLGSRLALLDANRNVIAGPIDEGRVSAIRAVDVTDADGRTTTVGWLSLSVTDVGQITADNAFLARQLQTLILTAVLAVALSAIAAFLLARQFLSPVRDLIAGTRELAAGNFAARMANTRRDEFGHLIDRFNALAASLEEAEQAERRWISDASHELQTPLAVLRAEVEALLDGVRQPDEKTLADIRASILRLSRLVADLNTLSRADEQRLMVERVDDDLSEIVTEAVDAAAIRMEGAGLTVETDIAPDVNFACDRVRLRQLLDNLLENARRYTDAPGRVVVRLAATPSGVMLTIEDTPPAPPDEVLDDLFRRFYRVDASRSREHGGSGLGLAICRAIVLAHDGAIEAQRSDLGGLAVIVTFPRDT